MRQKYIELLGKQRTKEYNRVFFNGPISLVRSLKLEEITDSLRERIQHLDDMVLCQQKKVKHMVEEVSCAPCRKPVMHPYKESNDLADD